MRGISVPRRFSVLLIVMLLPTAAALGGNEFDKVVKQIEKQYKVKKRHIPMLGLAGLAVKIVRPAGVKEFKLAMFDNHDFSRKPGDPNFKAIIHDTLNSNNWGPLVQTQTRNNRSYVYSRIKGKDIQLLIVTFNSNDAEVVQAKVNPDTLAKWIDKGNGDGILSAFNLGGGNGSTIGLFGGGGNDIDRSAYDSDSTSKSSDDSVATSASTTSTSASATPKSKPELKAPKDVTSVDSTDVVEKTATKADDADSLLDKDAIKLSSRLVNLNVKVTDQMGRVISGLKKEDFAVFDENISQEITHFEPNTAPVKLVLLIDLSGSTEKKTKLIKKSAMKFVDSLNPGDQIAVATFTRRFTLVSDFTTDHKLLKDRIDHLKNRGSGTAYYDAMWSALNLFGRSSESRQAIVVLTDGVDNAISNPEDAPAKHPFDQLLSRVGEEDVTIYPIYLDTEEEVVGKHGHGDSHEDYAVARKQLNDISEQTGGVLFKAARAEDLNGVYQRVAAELHTVYTIAYAPNASTNKGQWRKVSVKLNQAGTVARTRRGYFSK